MYCMSASFQRIHSGVRVNRGLECSVRGGKCWAGMAEIKESTSWTGRSLPVLEKTGCIYLDYNATTPIYPEVRSRKSMREHVQSGSFLVCCALLTLVICFNECESGKGSHSTVLHITLKTGAANRVVSDSPDELFCCRWPRLWNLSCMRTLGEEHRNQSVQFFSILAQIICNVLI